MLLAVVLLFFSQYRIVYPYKHAKEIASKVWPERCNGDERILNECNWCVCDKQTLRYVCKARVCHEVDMFGHFNDAISEYVVGIEGHGSWRTAGNSCSPGMQYQREGLLCVCDDEGKWPSPVCRDLFRVLHQVDLTGHTHPSALHECTPRKLYLYGCNVCFCPPEGRIDPGSCTRFNCSAHDPILAPPQTIIEAENKYNVTEVYAQCELQRKYAVGCSSCVCLKHNILICDECENSDVRSERDNYCEREGQGQAFSIDCNMCICDEHNSMYCTTRKCLKNDQKPSIELSKSVDLTLRNVRPPADSDDCVPGTKYREECNTCFCSETSDGEKVLSCTMKPCYNFDKGNLSLTNEIRSDCVENTVYEMNCEVCRCDVVDGVKRESCLVDSNCRNNDTMLREKRSFNLDSLHGYCEPSHFYRKDCNTCKCLADGKVVSCTDRICSRAQRPRQRPLQRPRQRPLQRPRQRPLQRPSEQRPLVVDVVPARQDRSAPCSPQHMYKVGCNFCFCLSNGNFLCTTAECDESGNIREDYQFE